MSNADNSFDITSPGVITPLESNEQYINGVSNQQSKPSYTPVRRNHPQVGYQRTKPQSPKILLPQCFLDQPLGPLMPMNGQGAINEFNGATGQFGGGAEGI